MNISVTQGTLRCVLKYTVHFGSFTLESGRKLYIFYLICGLLAVCLLTQTLAANDEDKHVCISEDPEECVKYFCR